MDLLDFNDCELYFEVPLPPDVERLMLLASESRDSEAESALLSAHALAPDHLTVLVGLYRFYFFRHRLDDALIVAERAMSLTGVQLGLPPDWRELDETLLGRAATTSFGLLRFHLLALKAICVVLLRLGRIAPARERLEKLVALDRHDRFSGARLLEIVDEFRHPEDACAEPVMAVA
jgi:hypothetical protein